MADVRRIKLAIFISGPSFLWVCLVYTIPAQITTYILETADKNLSLTNRPVLHILFRTKARKGSSTPPPPFQRAAVLVRGRNGDRAKSSPSPGPEPPVGTGGPSRYRGNERPPSGEIQVVPRTFKFALSNSLGRFFLCFPIEERKMRQVLAPSGQPDLMRTPRKGECSNEQRTAQSL